MVLKLYSCVFHHLGSETEVLSILIAGEDEATARLLALNKAAIEHFDIGAGPVIEDTGMVIADRPNTLEQRVLSSFIDEGL